MAVLKPSESTTRHRTLDEFRVEWFSGTGKGGQHRNKHQNSCRLIHPPTGLIQTAVGRERASNLDSALAEMNRRLNKLVLGRHAERENASRKSQLGSGMRGDKRRTYRLRDDFVRDDITGKEAQSSKVMKGRFDLLWQGKTTTRGYRGSGSGSSDHPNKEVRHGRCYRLR